MTSSNGPLSYNLMDENIADLERQYNDEVENERLDEESPSKRSEWWFVKTAFPLIAVCTQACTTNTKEC